MHNACKKEGRREGGNQVDGWEERRAICSGLFCKCEGNERSYISLHLYPFAFSTQYWPSEQRNIKIEIKSKHAIFVLFKKNMYCRWRKRGGEIRRSIEDLSLRKYERKSYCLRVIACVWLRVYDCVCMSVRMSVCVWLFACNCVCTIVCVWLWEWVCVYECEWERARETVLPQSISWSESEEL